MSLDQFRYFLAAARFEHVGRAAQSVAISPSAVSTAIAALEGDYGCQLFRREGKSIVLNEQGKYLRTELEALFDQLARIRGNLTGNAVEVEGSYRLGASHYLASHVLARAWVAVQREHPKLEGALRSLHTADAIDGVLRGTLDLSVVFSPLRHPELRQTELHAGKLIVVVRRGHPIWRVPAADRLRELSAYPAALHKAAAGVEICEVHPMFERYDLVPQIRCLWENDDQALESVVHTDSWAMIPEVVMRTAPATVRALPLPRGWIAPYNICAITRPHRADNRTLAMLVDQLRAVLATKRGRSA